MQAWTGDSPTGPHQMGASSPHEVTELLRAWRGGNEDALQQLIPIVYPELHRVARRFMARERTEHTLQTTALVNEVYLRLVQLQDAAWENRSHFFALCARLMRNILTDLARSRHYQKRGGNATHLRVDEALAVAQQRPADIVALDDALKALSAVDARKVQVVELRFFGGLSVEQTAEVLEISPETVMRDWRLAKTWLWRELSREKRDGA